MGSPNLTPAPRYIRSPFEPRPTIKRIPSSYGPHSSTEGLDMTPGRPNHRHPRLSAQQVSFGPSPTSAVTTTSEHGREVNYKPSPPSSAVVRSRQPEYPNSGGNPPFHGSVRPHLYSPTIRILPVPQSRSKPAHRRRPPITFDPNAMVRSPDKPTSA
jgi:hypothetical protein